MLVILDDGAFEPSLPHVAAGVVVLVIALRVRDQQALHDAADGGRPRPDQKMKVVIQKAVAVQLERLPLFQLA